jgi:hypothetical protein
MLGTKCNDAVNLQEEYANHWENRGREAERLNGELHLQLISVLCVLG